MGASGFTNVSPPVGCESSTSVIDEVDCFCIPKEAIRTRRAGAPIAILGGALAATPVRVEYLRITGRTGRKPGDAGKRGR